MSKKTQLYGRDKEGYMTLIPKIQHVAGSSTHESESAEYWKARALHAEEKCEKLKGHLNIQYGGRLKPVQPDDDEEAERALAELEEESRRLDAELDELIGTPTSKFSAGLGLTFGPGKEPKLYGLSDPSGAHSDEKFAGGEIEIQPGRGFHIGLHWRKD